MNDDRVVLELHADCDVFPVLLTFTPASGHSVVSSRQINEGELIVKSSAYSCAPFDAIIQITCLRCFGSCEARSYKCGSCQKAYYCGLECYNNDKRLHAHECEALGKLDTLDMSKQETCSIRILIRILACYSMENQDDSFCSLFRGYLHDSICPFHNILALEHHTDKIDIETKSAVKRVARAVGKLFSSRIRKLLSTEIIVQLFFAIQSNAHVIATESMLGIGLFPLASMLNHSCLPNVALSFTVGDSNRPPSLTFRAIRNISEGEELCYSYIDVYQTTQQRKAKLFAVYNFSCACLRCSAYEHFCQLLNCNGMQTFFDGNFNATEIAHEASIDGLKCLNSKPCCGPLVIFTQDNELFAVCLQCKTASSEPVSLQKQLILTVSKLENAIDIAANQLNEPDSENMEAFKLSLLNAGAVLHVHHQSLLRGYRTYVLLCERYLNSTENLLYDIKNINICQDWITSAEYIIDCLSTRLEMRVSKTCAEIYFQLVKAIQYLVKVVLISGEQKIQFCLNNESRVLSIADLNGTIEEYENISSRIYSICCGSDCYYCCCK